MDSSLFFLLPRLFSFLNGAPLCAPPPMKSASAAARANESAPPTATPPPSRAPFQPDSREERREERKGTALIHVERERDKEGRKLRGSNDDNSFQLA